MLSYAKGPDAPFLEKTIDQVVAETAARFPDREALVVRHQDVRLTWSELAASVERVARGLAGLGLNSGDRIGLWATNCAEWPIVQLACARAQLVLVNINPAYRAHELRYVLTRGDLKALILRDADDKASYRDILDEAAAGQTTSLRSIVYLEHPSWDEMLAAGKDLPASTADPNDVVNMQYTSGTTGNPKGVLLTHRNQVNNGRVIADGLQATEHDRLCIPVPMYHCFGSVIGTMAWIVSGCTLVIPAPRFDALKVLETIETERCTAVYGVPAMFIAELEHPEFRRFDLRSLRSGMMAGAPCPIEVMKRVTTDMHCTGMTIGYGQTESTPIITMSNADDAIDTRVSTVGCPRQNTEVKIVSMSTRETLPVGEQGELCARGYLIMKGYDQDPEATRRAIDEEGWLHTGDLAVMREDGYVKITGRAKDVIIRGGENISPREVEEFLFTHPKIAEVQIVGVPDLKLGETLAAWIRLKSGADCTEDEVRSFCKDRIAHFKIPQYIRFVDQFPMTVSGKVQKYKIRATEIEDRHLEKAAGIQTA